MNQTSQMLLVVVGLMAGGFAAWNSIGDAPWQNRSSKNPFFSPESIKLQREANQSPDDDSLNSEAALKDLEHFMSRADPHCPPGITGNSDEALDKDFTEEQLQNALQAFDGIKGQSFAKPIHFCTAGRIALSLGDLKLAEAYFQKAADDHSPAAKYYLSREEFERPLPECLQLLTQAEVGGFKPAREAKAKIEQEMSATLDSQTADIDDPSLPPGVRPIATEDLGGMDPTLANEFLRDYRAFAESRADQKESARLLFGLGRLAFAQKQYPLAKQLLTKASERNSGGADFYLSKLPDIESQFSVRLGHLGQSAARGFKSAPAELAKLSQYQKNSTFDYGVFSHPEIIRDLHTGNIDGMLQNGARLNVSTNETGFLQGATDRYFTLVYITTIAKYVEDQENRFLFQQLAQKLIAESEQSGKAAGTAKEGQRKLGEMGAFTGGLAEILIPFGEAVKRFQGISSDGLTKGNIASGLNFLAALNRKDYGAAGFKQARVQIIEDKALYDAWTLLTYYQNAHKDENDVIHQAPRVPELKADVKKVYDSIVSYVWRFQSTL